MCAMFNGGVCAKGTTVTHYCWQDGSELPCCRSLKESKEKSTGACQSTMFEKSDPVPAESTWAYMTANYKKTLLRRGVNNIGIEAFDGGAVDEKFLELSFNVDGEAEDNYVQVAMAKRVTSVNDYYVDDQNFELVAVLTILIDKFDEHLLYDVLGNPWNADNDDTPPVIRTFVHPEDSEISKFGESIASFLNQ